jgi:hypothetical protein
MDSIIKKQLQPKQLIVQAVVALTLATFLVLAGCDGGDPPTPEETEVEKATKLLAGTWTVQNVTVDGTDRTSVYKDVRITFSGSNLTATNGGVVWPASGTWRFTDDTAKTITRSDGLTISVNELTSNKLVAAFPWTKATLGGGRAESVAGQHVFTFGK